MGAGAIAVCRRLADSVQREMVASYRESLAAERMRSAAQRMDAAAAAAGIGDGSSARRDFDAGREAFTRELLNQAAGAAGTPRAPLVAAVDAAFQDLSALGPGPLGGAPDRSLEAMARTESSYYRVIGAIDALERQDYGRAEAAAARAESLSRRTVQVLVIAMGAALALSLFLAWSLAAYQEATESRVRRAQRTMEATLSSTPDPLIVVGRNGAETLRNPAAGKVEGPEGPGRGIPPALVEPLVQVLASGEHYLPTDYGRALVLRFGREDRHFLPRILALADRGGEPGGAAILLQDVTKFRLLDDAKTNLVGTVSHEIKTPLTSLRLAVYLLLEQRVGALSAAQVELLETARDEADRMLRIVDDLLDLARLESGEAALSRIEVRAADLLADMAREAGPIAAAAGQTIVVRCADDVGTVRADVDRLRHVFLNLLTNAGKYAHSGTTITLYAEPAPLGFVRFGVRDQGPGIPPEAVPRIFDRFFRVAGTRKNGAGLGLAIAREIVAAHGGAIGCSSRLGEGSDFHFTVPGNSPAPAAAAGAGGSS